MARVKICDGRSVMYQYDTGVLIELCDCRDFTECHFVTENGLIRREVENNICSVPDAALVKDGTLTVYAFSRNADGGQTQHTFFIHVLPRPRPVDYIDPPDEADNLEQLAERVAGMIDPDGGSSAPEIMKVTFTSPDGGDTIAADKTFAEMSEAYAAGKLLYAEVNIGIEVYDGQMQLFTFADDMFAFSRLTVVNDGVALYLVGVNSENETLANVAPISGGVGGAMMVNFSSTDGENWTADKTFAEVRAAFDNGEMVFARNQDNMIIPAMNVASDAVVFFLQVYENGTMLTLAYALRTDNTVEFMPSTEELGGSGSGGGGVVYVTITHSYGSGYTASMTNEEICQACESGKQVVCLLNGLLIPLCSVSESTAAFSILAPAGNDLLMGNTITIDNNVVNVTQVQMYETGVFVVNVKSVNSDGTFEVDKTTSDALEAHGAGIPVMLRLLNGACLPMHTMTGGFTFTYYDFVSEELATQYDVVFVDDYKMEVREHVISVKNPHPLVINGVSYDGSERVEIKEGEYEVIEVVPLDGLVRVDRTTEPDGTPYAFTDILVEYYISDKSDVVGHAYTTIHADGYQICYYGTGNAIQNASARFAMVGASVENGAAVTCATEPGVSADSLTTLKRKPSTAIGCKRITKVIAATNITFPVGSTLTIKGVRA